MKLYWDKELTKEIADNKIDFETIDAGDKREESIYIYNDSEAELMNINIEISDIEKELKVLAFPKYLKSKESGVITIEVKAKVDIEKKVSGILAYKAEKIYR